MGDGEAHGRVVGVEGEELPVEAAGLVGVPILRVDPGEALERILMTGLQLQHLLIVVGGRVEMDPRAGRVGFGDDAEGRPLVVERDGTLRVDGERPVTVLERVLRLAAADILLAEGDGALESDRFLEGGDDRLRHRVRVVPPADGERGNADLFAIPHIREGGLHPEVCALRLHGTEHHQLSLELRGQLPAGDRVQLLALDAVLLAGLAKLRMRDRRVGREVLERAGDLVGDVLAEAAVDPLGAQRHDQDFPPAADAALLLLSGGGGKGCRRGHSSAEDRRSEGAAKNGPA